MREIAARLGFDLISQRLELFGRKRPPPPAAAASRKLAARRGGTLPRGGTPQ